MDINPVKQLRVAPSTQASAVPNGDDHYFEVDVELAGGFFDGFTANELWTVEADGRVYEFTAPNLPTAQRLERNLETIANGIAALINLDSGRHSRPWS